MNETSQTFLIHYSDIVDYIVTVTQAHATCMDYHSVAAAFSSTSIVEFVLSQWRWRLPWQISGHYFRLPSSWMIEQYFVSNSRNNSILHIDFGCLTYQWIKIGLKLKYVSIRWRVPLSNKAQWYFSEALVNLNEIFYALDENVSLLKINSSVVCLLLCDFEELFYLPSKVISVWEHFI